MDIKWHGKTCFSLKEKGVNVVINPHKDSGAPKSGIVISSLEEGTFEFDEETKVFDWPGEYEVEGVPLVGVRAWTKSKTKEEQEGSEGEPTIIFYFEVAGVKCCHLGDLGHVLTSDMVKDIGDVDILMMKLGETSNLDAKKTAEVIESIDPRVLIPMGSGNFSEVLKEVGAGDLAPQDVFTVKSASDLPDDRREYVILNKA